MRFKRKLTHWKALPKSNCALCLRLKRTLQSSRNKPVTQFLLQIKTRWMHQAQHSCNTKSEAIQQSAQLQVVHVILQRPQSSKHQGRLINLHQEHQHRLGCLATKQQRRVRELGRKTTTNKKKQSKMRRKQKERMHRHSSTPQRTLLSQLLVHLSRSACLVCNLKLRVMFSMKKMIERH